jgi:hypothetical protein
MPLQFPEPTFYEEWQPWGTGLIRALFIAFAGINPEVGEIRVFAVSLPPTGYVLADGSNIDNASFPILAQRLGATFGTAPAGKTKLPSLTSPYGANTVVGIRA